MKWSQDELDALKVGLDKTHAAKEKLAEKLAAKAKAKNNPQPQG